jgi:hypothetical protein
MPGVVDVPWDNVWRFLCILSLGLYGSDLMLLGSDSYIHWVGYWFNFGMLRVVFPYLYLFVMYTVPLCFTAVTLRLVRE